MVNNASASAQSDLGEFPSPHLAVDLVLVTVEDDCLKVLLMERASEPFAGRLVLPGGFVHPGESLEKTAQNVMESKTGLQDIPVEQLYTFSDPERDPRGWVVSAAYFALVPAGKLNNAVDGQNDLSLVKIIPAAGPGQFKSRRSPPPPKIHLERDGTRIEPGFDHLLILTTALDRLRGKLDWSLVAFGLLPQTFTLFELQRVHELILGRSVNKPHFRTKMLGRTFPDGRKLVATGKFSRTGRHRPAELYRLG